jgi:hypothetical protein
MILDNSWLRFYVNLDASVERPAPASWLLASGGDAMMANEPPMSDAGGDAAAELTSDQHAALESRQVDQDRTLASVHALEGALASAAPGREGPWRDSVRAALDVLGAAAAEEEQNAAQPDSLLSDIARSQPRLRHRVHGLRAQYRQVRDTIAAIRPELDHQATDLDVADLRQRLAWLLTALRHQRARESDLIYAAYYEAFDRDLERDA